MPYKDQLNRFKAQMAFAGIDRVHCFRHAYAQVHYTKLTGWRTPTAGGRPTSTQLSPEQKAIDKQGGSFPVSWVMKASTSQWSTLTTKFALAYVGLLLIQPTMIP